MMRNIFEQIITTQQNRLLPNRWDFIALSLVLSCFILLGWAAKQMGVPYHVGESISISLDYTYLPSYAMQTVLRIFLALILSSLFTLVFATLAAKNKYAERIIIPLIDVLQSVPVLGFLSITVVGFINLFPNSRLGPECASIFAIFTAQAWNMTFSLYQSLRTLPGELREAADVFQLSAWQRFWRIEFPFAIPGLLWNTMMSISASWFSLVFSEAITVANHHITLPGIGSYIALAIQQANLQAVFYAIICMLIVITSYDQLFFRPLIKWSERFKAEHEANDKEIYAWVTDLLQRTYILRYCGIFLAACFDKFVNLPWLSRRLDQHPITVKNTLILSIFWYCLIFSATIISLVLLYQFMATGIDFNEVKYALKIGSFTALRVITLIILCSFIWVPIGVWIGLRPRMVAIIQPIAQFLASFPTNLLFPLIVLGILRYHLNVEIWLTTLMLLGAQWYILFNIIAGTSALPKDLNQVTRNLDVRGWLWWRRFILPGIFPYYVTGAMTATGGAWNASIVAEIVHWGDIKLKATGIGAYITENTQSGDFQHLTLGIVVMCLMVLVFNHAIWRPLYVLAETRFKLD